MTTPQDYVAHLQQTVDGLNRRFIDGLQALRAEDERVLQHERELFQQELLVRDKQAHDALAAQQNAHAAEIATLRVRFEDQLFRQLEVHERALTDLHRGRGAETEGSSTLGGNAARHDGRFMSPQHVAFLETALKQEHTKVPT
jgi:hypothetical protein